MEIPDSDKHKSFPRQDLNYRSKKLLTMQGPMLLRTCTGVKCNNLHLRMYLKLLNSFQSKFTKQASLLSTAVNYKLNLLIKLALGPRGFDPTFFQPRRSQPITIFIEFSAKKSFSVPKVQYYIFLF